MEDINQPRREFKVTENRNGRRYIVSQILRSESSVNDFVRNLKTRFPSKTYDVVSRTVTEWEPYNGNPAL